MRERYALFDLDFTLVPEDTRLLFANYVYRKMPWRRVFLLIILPASMLALAGLLSRSFFNRIFFCFLTGLSVSELDALAEDFVQNHIPFYPDMLERLQTEKSRGSIIVLATASPSVYISPLARRLGANITLCTEWKIQEEHPLLVSYQSMYNKGPAKIRSLLPHLPEQIQEGIRRFEAGKRYQLPGSSAYSDSANDLPMLLLAENATVIHPSRRLRGLAERKHWQILRPAPTDRTGERFRRAILQCLGAYRRFSIDSTASLTNLHSQP